MATGEVKRSGFAPNPRQGHLPCPTPATGSKHEYGDKGHGLRGGPPDPTDCQPLDPRAIKPDEMKRRAGRWRRTIRSISTTIRSRSLISVGERLAAIARDSIYRDFLRLARPTPASKILDVGVSDVVGEAANVLERKYPNLEQVTAVGLGTAHESPWAAFPQVAYQRIVAGEPLPFSRPARSTSPPVTRCWSMSAAMRRN